MEEKQDLITIEAPKGYKIKQVFEDKITFEKYEVRPTDLREAADILRLSNHSFYRTELMKNFHKIHFQLDLN